MVPQGLTSRYLLSASIPDPRREPLYYDTADLTAIREAVTAVSTVARIRPIIEQVMADVPDAVSRFPATHLALGETK
jgi:hypothetical protein